MPINVSRFWRYGFPVVFGLIVYISIRLVNDSMAGEQFWQRSLRQNVIEVLSVIILGYISDLLLRKSFKKLNERRPTISQKNVIQEFLVILLISMALFNPALYIIHVLIRDPLQWNDVIIGDMLVALYVMLYYAIVRGNIIIRSFVQQEMQLEKLRNEQLQLELKFLKAQYHPHFLFNAINSIYFQMDENVPAAKATLLQFAGLLRYQLYDQYKPVRLEQELEYLENFIQLQKTRASEQLQLNYHFPKAVNGTMIYPLLFMPLVENAFKYVGGDYSITMELKLESGQLLFEVRNSVAAMRTVSKEGGIGLENLQRRLELLYPGAHELRLQNTEKSFSATLKLPLHEPVLHHN